MVTGSFVRSTSARLMPRSVSNPRASAHRRRFVSPFLGSPFCTISVIFVLVSLALVSGFSVYLYIFEGLLSGESSVAGFAVRYDLCDVSDGIWVQDNSYPLYNSSECPFAERGFNCLANGREDVEYLKWRWKPRHCNLPQFNVLEVLEWLRGKRVVFVGDSMSRTQWESFICMLMTGVEDPKTVYEVNGNMISKTIRFLAVRFKTFDLSVEFYRSVFLVQQGSPPRHTPRRVRMTLRLDKMDEMHQRWINSDVLIFNTGHWWTPSKLFDMGCYFQAGGVLKLGVPVNSAFRLALETWANWVETMVDTNKTRVFFRTYEPSHWSGPNQKVCNVTQQPLPKAKTDEKVEFSEIMADVVAKMKVPVTVLNVTLMGAYRSDAHIGNWSYPPTILDCSHWCLPGVPDAWNELVTTYLLTDGWRMRR